MRKSTLIAKFLVNLRNGFDALEAEHIVETTFFDKHPNVDFHTWNTELDDAWCENLIRANTSLSFVSVENFILQLWDIH